MNVVYFFSFKFVSIFFFCYITIHLAMIYKGCDDHEGKLDFCGFLFFFCCWKSSPIWKKRRITKANERSAPPNTLYICRHYIEVSPNIAPVTHVARDSVDPKKCFIYTTEFSISLIHSHCILKQAIAFPKPLYLIFVH